MLDQYPSHAEGQAESMGREAAKELMSLYESRPLLQSPTLSDSQQTSSVRPGRLFAFRSGEPYFEATCASALNIMSVYEGSHSWRRTVQFEMGQAELAPPVLSSDFSSVLFCRMWTMDAQVEG